VSIRECPRRLVPEGPEPHRHQGRLDVAGHGLPDPANPKEGDTFLVPADGDPEARGTLINLRDLIARLEGSTAKNVLVLLDACYSGLKGSRGLMAGPLFRQQKAVVLSGANNGQASFEFEKAGHGYFTYYMLLGLKGQADAAPYGNSDGAVTDSELCAYVKASMSEATSGRQTPVCHMRENINIFDAGNFMDSLVQFDICEDSSGKSDLCLACFLQPESHIIRNHFFKNFLQSCCYMYGWKLHYFVKQSVIR